MDERERRIKIALRMKAGRFLAGGWGKKGATPMATADIVQLAPMVNEGITDDRLQSIEQIKRGTAPPRGSEMRAFIETLQLPHDWFDGLYPADRGEATTALGGVLQAVAEVAREHRQAREAIERSRAGKDRPPAAGGGHGG